MERRFNNCQRRAWHKYRVWDTITNIIVIVTFASRAHDNTVSVGQTAAICVRKGNYRCLVRSLVFAISSWRSLQIIFSSCRGSCGLRDASRGNSGRQVRFDVMFLRAAQFAIDIQPRRGLKGSNRRCTETQWDSIRDKLIVAALWNSLELDIAEAKPKSSNTWP